MQIISIIATFFKTLLVGAAPVAPTQAEMDEFDSYDEYATGCYPSPSEVHEWDVEFYVASLRRPLGIIVLWKYVATDKHTPRWIRSLAWKVCHTHFNF